MSNAIQAVTDLINTYQPNDELASAIEHIFDTDEDFLVKVEKFDAAFAKHTTHQEIEEYAFDLLMTHHLANHNEDEDYFDSPEWQIIEDKTLERGTELLNMLLYISEANDNHAEVDLEDFLYEFLLVDEDEFQDEHRIYEELIANSDLVEEETKIIVEVSSRIPENNEIKELFTPLLLFFRDTTAKEIHPADAELITPAERALLQTMLSFNL